MLTMGTQCHSMALDMAPCPPNFVDDVYQVFMDTAAVTTLSECEVDLIIERCKIDIPTTTTTTTTSTTTTTTPSTPSTTSEETTTTEEPTAPSTESTSSLSSSSFSATPISTNASTSGSDVSTTSLNSSTREASSALPVTTESVSSESTERFKPSSHLTSTIRASKDNVPTSSFSSTISSTMNVTGIFNVTTVPDSVPSVVCGGICITVLVTGVLCLLLVVTVAMALLFRKTRDKPERGRSRKRFKDLPNISLYDSIDIQESDFRTGTAVLRHDTSDYSLTPAFDNPAYRRSLELNGCPHSSWYDPEATNYEYSQHMANLTMRRRHSPDGRSLPRTPLNDRRQVDMVNYDQTRRHKSLQDYVPKSLRNRDSSPDKRLPYSSQNGNTQYNAHPRTRSPSRRSLPRTPIENRRNGQNEQSAHRSRHSYKRSRSYDPDLAKESRSRDVEFYPPNRGKKVEPVSPVRDYYTVDNRHSKKHYVKNSQKTRQPTQSGFNDKSTRRKTRCQSDSDAVEENMWTHNIIRNGSGHVSSDFIYGYGEPRCNKSKFKSGSYHHGGQQTVFTDSDVFNGWYRGRSGTNHRKRSQSANAYEREMVRSASYQPHSREQVYLFQTKL